MGAAARDQLAAAGRRLTDAGVSSPRVDAELLLAHLLGVNRSRLLTVADLDAEQQSRFHALIALRCQRIPLQHLTGRAPFRHLDLAVGPGVFIPRPETELLLDLVADALTDARTVVDLGAGSGAIALAVAQEFHTGRMIAVERSVDAIGWLRRNAEARAAAGDTPIDIIEADIADPDLLAAESGTVDVVLSNPPYVPSRLRPELSVEVGHDPDDAVFAGGDGLALMPAVIAAAARLLRPGGLVAIEQDDSHADSVIHLMQAARQWAAISGHHDLAGRLRFTTAVRLSDAG
ncbi:MAG TPA: peptide chain release factor N(5)-glutamine methyltransferase [Jatrophihabitans sp.]|jgi:release factor glutamine methyltransferase